MNTQYTTNLVNCSIDEPLQTLMDRLSSKSSQLYIFWQNYNQLYNLYQEKMTEIHRLRQQINILKWQNQQQPKVQLVQDTFIKQRYLNLQKNFNDLKLQNDSLKNQCNQLRRQTTKHYEENLQLQTLLQQLRDENIIQRQTIQKILNQLKAAKTELSSYCRLYEDVQQKDLQIARLLENEKRLNNIIVERQDEIDELVEAEKQLKIRYEGLLKDSLQSAKTRVIESLPNLIKTSKQKVQIVTN